LNIRVTLEGWIACRRPFFQHLMKIGSSDFRPARRIQSSTAFVPRRDGNE
jgi:hypothetical protein